MDEEILLPDTKALLLKQEGCQHRWEQTFFGAQFLLPGTWQFTCHRCGKVNMIRLGVDHG